MFFIPSEKLFSFLRYLNCYPAFYIINWETNSYNTPIT